MTVMTAQELADHAQDAFENNLMDDPTPYETAVAWKAVGQHLFDILVERAEEERAPEIAYLVNQLDAIRRDNWLTMSFEKQDALDAAADTLNRQAAELKQLREEMVRMEVRLRRWEPRVSLDLSQMLTGAASDRTAFTTGEEQ